MCRKSGRWLVYEEGRGSPWKGRKSFQGPVGAGAPGGGRAARTTQPAGTTGSPQESEVNSRQ